VRLLVPAVLLVLAAAAAAAAATVLPRVRVVQPLVQAVTHPLTAASAARRRRPSPV
jgi:tRNA A37 threonylcarbamoyladenosine synthetase subunit TsaC/SUA5/YrdC